VIGSVLPRLEARERKRVAIDETKIKLSGRTVYVWAARDIDSREIIAVKLL